MTSPRPTLVTAWLLIPVLGALSILGPFGTDTFLPALPDIAVHFGTTAARAQLTLSAFSIGMAVGQLVIGTLSDRVGRRRLLIAGPGLMALSSAAAAMSPSLALLLVSCLVMGLSSASAMVVSRAVASDISTGDSATRLFSALGLMTAIGPVVGPLGGALILAFWNWQSIFLALAVFALVVMLSVVLTVPETLPPEHRVAEMGFRALRGSFREILGTPGYLASAAIVWFGIGATFAYISASPFIVQSILGFSALTFAVIFGINGVGLILAGVASTALAGRLEPRRLIAIGLGVQATGAALLVGTVVVAAILDAPISPWLILPAMFLVNGSIGLMFGPATALAVADLRHRAGTALALLGSIQFVVAGITAPLAGVAGEGSALPFVVIAACCSALATLVFIIGGRRAAFARNVRAVQL